MKKLMVLLMAFVLFLFPVSAWAADAASGKKIEIQFKLGEDTILINGESVTVEKPFVDNGVTLVPVRVITSAFGAAITWDSATQTVGLKYGTHTLKLVIDSNEASVDGKTVELEAAPQLLNGTTMVPLRFISENFGAKVNFDAETGTIGIEGLASASSNDPGGIDVDAGKTKVGDSYYGWSMKYPTGLIIQNQSYKKNIVIFGDAGNEYSIVIYIKDSATDKLSKEGLMYELADNVNRTTILSKSTETSGGVSYARILSKDANGAYFEDRAYQSNDKIYIVTLKINKEDNYKNQAKSQGYKDLLDSFTLRYDTADNSIKDISNVKNGMRSFATDDYGFRLNLPADWNKSSSNDNNFYFYGDSTSKQSISVEVTSVGSETLEQWQARDEKDFLDTFVADYRKSSGYKMIKLAGLTAAEKTVSYKLGDTWSNYYNLMVFKDKLKYEINYFYKEDAPEKEVAARKTMIAESFTLTGRLNSSLGKIEDTITNYDSKITVKNKLGKFTVQLPEYWAEVTENEKDGYLSYSFLGGDFAITSTPESKANKAAYTQLFQNKYQDSAKNSSDFRILESKEVPLLGTTAYMFKLEEKVNGGIVNSTHYIFTMQGMTYNIIYSINKGVQTDVKVKRLEDAVQSFKLMPQ